MWIKSIGQVIAKEAYVAIVSMHNICDKNWWNVKLWKWNLPQKLKCLFCLMMENKILTWKNILMEGWNDPEICLLYRRDEESTRHLFIKCAFSKTVWLCVFGDLNINSPWGESNLDDSFKD